LQAASEKMNRRRRVSMRPLCCWRVFTFHVFANSWLGLDLGLIL
jgi:hypothetical protein